MTRTSARMRALTSVLTLALSAVVAAGAVVAAAPSQAAPSVDAKVRFQTSAMASMPAEYAKKWAGQPATSWLYVNGALRGGRVDLQVQKKGTKKWVDLVSVAVPTTACKGAHCDELYDDQRSIAPDEKAGSYFKKSWYTAPAPGTWSVRYRYVPGAKGNGKAVGWTVASVDGAKQTIVTAAVPIKTVTPKAPSAVKAKKSVKVTVTAQLVDLTTVFAWEQAYEGEKALKVPGPVATVTYVPAKGKKVTLGKVRLTRYDDAHARFSGSAKLKVAAPKGKGTLKITVKGASVKTKSTTKAITVR